jgi:hypothetical protein
MRRTRRPMRRPLAAPRGDAARWPRLDPEIHGDLDDFARAIDTLDAGDLQRLVAFWDGISGPSREDAHLHAQAAAARTERREVINALQEDLLEWASPSESARGGRIDAWLPATEPLDQYARRNALPALLDTALALAVQDELDDDDFETLFGPWRDAMGDGEEDVDEAAGPAPVADHDAPPVD